MPNVRYVGALDPASRHDEFALAILHESAEGKIVVDRLERWRGTKSAPLAFDLVLGEVRNVLSLYHLNTAVGDQFYYDLLNQYFLKLGIYYECRQFSANTRATIFANMKQLLLSNKLELLDDPELLRQLRHLREQKTARGHAPNATARELTGQEPRIDPVQRGIVEIVPRSFPSLIPGICQLEACCKNFPRCMDVNSCQGFVRE